VVNRYGFDTDLFYIWIPSTDKKNPFESIAFPLVNRTFGRLLGSDLVSVQPLSAPSGLITYLDYTFNSNPGPPSDEI